MVVIHLFSTQVGSIQLLEDMKFCLFKNYGIDELFLLEHANDLFLRQKYRYLFLNIRVLDLWIFYFRFIRWINPFGLVK